MTLIVNGFLGPLLLTGGLNSSAVPAATPYVDPDAGTLIAVSEVSTNDVDPDAGTLITQ